MVVGREVRTEAYLKAKGREKKKSRTAIGKAWGEKVCEKW